jgi:hypothetical protein
VQSTVLNPFEHLAALELGVNYALAADDCITESNLVPRKGTRWDYRIDRTANRKCWFLMKVTTAPVAPQTRRPLPRSTLARVPPEHRSVRNLSESEQAALFLEFLRWKEQQSAVNSNAAAESLRGTISPWFCSISWEIDKRGSVSAASCPSRAWCGSSTERSLTVIGHLRTPTGVGDMRLLQEI